MEVIQTKIPGLLILEAQVFIDPRGYFMETYSQKEWEQKGLKYSFVQDNESCSSKGVLRGLHFQKPPFAQNKIVRVIRGAVWDVAVDIRKGSPTYGQYVGVELSEENKKQFFLPAGMAHGFMTLRDHTIFAYKVSSLYAPQSEGGILWNDTDLQIEWPIESCDLQEVILSEKDRKNERFLDFESPFIF